MALKKLDWSFCAYLIQYPSEPRAIPFSAQTNTAKGF